MSKFASFAEYPALGLAGAEAALLTAWAALNRFHEDLVLVGGLALKYLTLPGSGLLPGPVTIDVDLGVAVAAEGGQYGTIADDLIGQGFRRSENGRYVREHNGYPVFIDFLTEDPHSERETVDVDGTPAGNFLGVNRALETRKPVAIKGQDVFGAVQQFNIPICGIGPLLVLKLNAFAGRQQPKDAYDILLAVSRYSEGPETAIAAFRAEQTAENRGYARAVKTLRSHFSRDDQSGPLRCTAFLGQADSQRATQIAELTVTIGRALLGDDPHS